MILLNTTPSLSNTHIYISCSKATSGYRSDCNSGKGGSQLKYYEEQQCLPHSWWWHNGPAHTSNIIFPPPPILFKNQYSGASRKVAA